MQDDRAMLETAFDPASEADWRALVEKGLKGRPFDSLRTEAVDGFRYGPIHARRPDAAPLARLDHGPWTIVQSVDDPDPARANRQALEDLTGGANGLALAFAGAPAAFGFGLAPDAPLETLLSEVDTRLIAIRVEPHAEARAIAERLAPLLAGRDRQAPPVDLGYDPVGTGAAAGAFAFDVGDPLPAIGEDLRALMAHGWSARIAEADASLYHDAGASPGQELGASLATACLFLRAFEAIGVGPETAAARIGLTLACDQDEFQTIATFRALRLLWARLLEACGLDDAPPPRIHARTSWRMMAGRDPHTNLLRTTIAAFAAGAGGADSLTVLPYTAPLGLAAPGARRLARNIQIMLQEETGLDRPIDPACGAGAFEALTDALCHAGWSAFREIEAEGGIAESLAAGRLQARISEVRHARIAALRSGAAPMIGASIYPLGKEREHRLLMPRGAATAPARAGDFAPLAPTRLNAGLETVAEDGR